MKIQIPRKIRTEDFEEDLRPSLGTLAEIYNSFADDVYRVLNNGVDFDNLRRQIIQLEVNIDGSGRIVNSPKVKINVLGRVAGINVIRAENTINPTIFPTTAPFASYVSNGNIITITNCTGLQNNSQYRLTLEIIVSG